MYMGSNNVDMACALAVLVFNDGAAYFEERFYCVTVRYMYIIMLIWEIHNFWGSSCMGTVRIRMNHFTHAVVWKFCLKTLYIHVYGKQQF